VLGWVGDHFRIPTVGVAVDPTHIRPDDPAVQAVVRAHRSALRVITTGGQADLDVGAAAITAVAAELGVPAAVTAAEFYRTES
jgi:hypothetical protein